MKKLMNFRPILFLSASIAVGILSAYFLHYESLALCICFSLIFLLSIIIFSIIYKGENNENFYRNLSFGIIAVIVFSVGFLGFNLKVKNYKSANLNGHQYVISGKITELYEKDSGYQIILDNVELQNYHEKVCYKLQLFVNGKSNLKLGDYIKFSSVVVDYGDIYDGRFSAENITNKIKYRAIANADQITVYDNKLNIFETIFVNIDNALKDGLDGQNYAIGLAMLVGQDDYIDTEILYNFRNAGIAHVFAVSGLHVGILAGVLLFITKKLRLNKTLSYFIVLVCCFLYSGVCGFSASSIRATIMCACLNLVNLNGKKYDNLTSISLAGLIILCYSPTSLFCAGFRLSFGVVLGIFLLNNPIKKLLKFIPKKFDKTKSSLSVVLSAQIASIPICLACFNKISLIAVLCNLIFLPLISFIYVFLFFSVLLSIISGLSVYLLFPSKIILNALIYLINILDYSVFTVGGFSFGIYSILYFLVILLVSGLVNIKIKPKVILCLILSTACVLLSVFSALFDYCALKVYANGGYTQSATLISKKDCSVLVLSNIDSQTNFYTVSRIVNKVGVKNLDAIIILNCKEINVDKLYSNVKGTVTASAVYIFGTEDNLEKLAFEKSFKTTLNYFLDNEQIVIKDFNLVSSFNGKSVTVKCQDKRIDIFAKLDQVVDDKYLETSSVIIAENFFERLFYQKENAYKIANSSDVDYPSTVNLGIIKITL